MDSWQILAQMTTPVWVVDLQTEQVRWLNAAALRFSNARDIAAMRHGIFSATSHPHLSAYLPELQLRKNITEVWTVASDQRPQALSCRYSCLDLEDGPALLVEGHQRLLTPAIAGQTASAPAAAVSHTHLPVMRQQVFYETLFRDNAAPMLLIDPAANGAIIDANHAALDFYGYDHSRMCGLHTWEINTLGSNVVPIMHEVASWDGSHKPLSFRHRLANGSVRDVQTYAGPIEFYGRRLMLCMVHDITAQKETEQFNRLLLECVHTGIFGVNLHSTLIFVNEAATRLLGYQHESQLLGAAIHHIGSDPDLTSTDGIATICARVLATGEPVTASECNLSRGDGTDFPALVFAAPIRASGNLTGVVVSFSDLSEQKEQETQLADLADSFPGAVFQLQTCAPGGSVFTYVSKGLRRLLGITDQRAVTPLAALLQVTHAEDRAALHQSLQQDHATLTQWQHEFRVQSHSGDTWLLGRAHTRRKRNGTVVLNGVLIDITARKQLEAELEQAARRDPLTNVWNRRQFTLVLGDIHSQSERYGHPYALLMIDVDNFKEVNDRYGHGVGDTVLIALAQLLQQRLRKSDTVCRWGGEEFLLLLPHSTLDMAIAVAQDLCAAVNQLSLPPLHHLSVSIGVSQSAPSRTSAEVIKRTDDALYLAKANGRNRVEWTAAP